MKNPRSVFLRALVMLLSLSWALSVMAEAPATFVAADPTTAEQFANAAPVILNGEVVFKVVGIRAYAAERRAKGISEQLQAVAADDSIDPSSIRHVDQADYTLIYVADADIDPRKFDETSYEKLRNKIVMTVFDVDAAYEGLNNRVVLAETYAILMRERIHKYRLERTPGELKKTALKAAGRTVVLVVTLVIVVLLFRFIDRWLERYFKRRIKKLEAKSMRVVQSEQVWRVWSTVFTLVKAAMFLGIIYLFLTMVLSLFPWTRYLANQSLQLVIGPLKVMAFGFIDYLPSLAFLVILYFITRYLLKIMYGFFEGVSRGNIPLKRFEADWAWPTYRIVRVIILIFALVIAYPYIPGSDSEAFKGISIFLGVLLSLGSTSVISNIIAGYTMTYRRAFRVGDRIRIGDTIGDVVDSRLLVTHLRSLKNENVVMPNSTLLNSEIINYTTLARQDGIILHTKVGIGYEVPWRQVEAMLLEAADRTEGLLKDPPPFVLQTALTDFAVTYELNVYCKDEMKMARLYTALHRNIQDVFNEYDVQIMTPNYVADTPDPKVVPTDKWYTPPARQPDHVEAETPAVPVTGNQDK